MSQRASGRGIVVAFITCPNARVAHRLARQLVREHAAACVNIIRHVQSYFWWQGKIDHAREHLLILKTTAARLPHIRRLLTQQHPYTVPELVAMPVRHGLPAYLAWVRSSCR